MAYPRFMKTCSSVTLSLKRRYVIIFIVSLQSKNQYQDLIVITIVYNTVISRYMS